MSRLRVEESPDGLTIREQSGKLGKPRFITIRPEEIVPLISALAGASEHYTVNELGCGEAKAPDAG